MSEGAASSSSSNTLRRMTADNPQSNGKGDDSLPYQLACDYISYRLSKAGRQWHDRPVLENVDYANPSPIFKAMRQLGDEFERRYLDVFEDMCESLQISNSTAYETFSNICNELFREGVRWGRVVALFTFGGAFALDCDRRQMPRLIGCIVEWVADYVETNLEGWISENNGWKGFLDFYEHRPANDPPQQGLIRRVMTGVGVACGALGVVTLGAILAARS